MPIRFPEIEENSKIDTKKLLMATEELIVVIDKFGKFISPITTDMSNNVKKIYSVYEKDKEANKYIQDLILDEKNRNEEYAIDALLWLKRALYFALRMYELIEEDYISGNHVTDDIDAYIKQAYTESLEPYHNWAARKLFQLVSKLAPSKTKIIKTLGIESDVETIKTELRGFNGSVRTCVMNIQEFYEKNGLENNNVVG